MGAQGVATILPVSFNHVPDALYQTLALPDPMTTLNKSFAEVSEKHQAEILESHLWDTPPMSVLVEGTGLPDPSIL